MKWGHALVTYFCSHANPVHKISILPRGKALGYTMQIPQEEKYLKSREDIKDEIKILLGGRIAEELCIHTITSGASQDIDRITELAKMYICSYGMSHVLGTRRYGKASEDVFLGKNYGSGNNAKDYSEDTSRIIDSEIQSLIQSCYLEAKKILEDNISLLHALSKKNT